MRTEPLLKDQSILVVNGGNDLFIYDLEDALVAVGADVLLARDVATALAFVARFDFLACLLGEIDDPRLAEELAGMPVLRLGDESVPAIIAKLMRMLGKGDTYTVRSKATSSAGGASTEAPIGVRRRTVWSTHNVCSSLLYVHICEPWLTVS